MTRIHTALLLNSPLLREACVYRLQKAADIKVVACGRPTASALKSLKRTCRVALVEIDPLTERSFKGVQALRERCPQTNIVLFSPAPSDRLIVRGINTGVRGLLTPEIRLNDFVTAIRRVAGGRLCFSPSVRSRLIVSKSADSVRVKSTVRIPRLSKRQFEVLRLVALGYTTAEMAEMSGRSEKSVESSKYRIMNKLGLRDRVSLSRYAIREGIIRP